jgi:hypothetical protein
MRIRLVLAMLVGCCTIACNKDDPTPQDLVTYTHEVDTEGWLFASGPDGTLLDSKKLEFNQPVSLSATDAPGSFSLTLVLIARERPLYIIASTYSGIAPGSVFTPKIYDPGPGEEFQQEGKVTVQVTNYPDEQELPLIVADQYQSTSYNGNGTSTPTFLMSVWKSKTSRFLVTGYNGDMMHPVYKYIDTPGVDATAYADFNTFTPFEKTLEIKGFDTDLNARVGFTMFSSVSNYATGMQFAEFGWDYKGTSPAANVGYLDDFEEYYFDLRIYEFNEQRDLRRLHKYTHRGALTKPIVALNDKLAVNNESMSSLSFSYTGNYDMTIHNYNYSDATSFIVWTVYSGPGDPSPVRDLPDDVISAYPDMDPLNLSYVSSSFYKYYDGYTYQKFIEDTFTTSYGPLHPGYEQAFFK